MSTINRIMRNAIGTSWTLTDDFQFTFFNKTRPIKVNSSEGLSSQDVYDIAIINVDLPQLGSNAEQVLMAGEWRIYNAKFQPFTFSVTFRDFGSLDLRNYFASVWMDAQKGYFDEIKSSVVIAVNQGIVFQSDDCLITAVSQVQLDNNNTQIAEFTVEFTSPYYTNSEINKFGSDGYNTSDTNPLNAIDTLIGEAGGVLGSLQSVVSTVKNWF